MTIAKVLRECGRRWTRHIAHGAFEAIDMRVHMIVEQLFGGVALVALVALESV